MPIGILNIPQNTADTLPINVLLAAQNAALNNAGLSAKLAYAPEAAKQELLKQKIANIFSQKQLPYAAQNAQADLLSKQLANKLAGSNVQYQPYKSQAEILNEQSLGRKTGAEALNLERSMGYNGQPIMQDGRIIGNTGIGAFNGSQQPNVQQIPNPQEVSYSLGGGAQSLPGMNQNNLQKNLSYLNSSSPQFPRQSFDNMSSEAKENLMKRLSDINRSDSKLNINDQTSSRQNPVRNKAQYGNPIYVRPSPEQQIEMESSLNKINNSNIDNEFEKLANSYKGQKTVPGYAKYETQKLFSKVLSTKNDTLNQANQYDEAHSHLTDLIRSTYTKSLGKAQADMFANSLDPKNAENQESYRARVYATKYWLKNYADKQAHAIEYGIPQNSDAANTTILNTFNPRNFIDLHSENSDAAKLVYKSLTPLEKQKLKIYNERIKKLGDK